MIVLNKYTNNVYGDIWVILKNAFNQFERVL